MSERAEGKLSELEEAVYKFESYYAELLERYKVTGSGELNLEKLVPAEAEAFDRHNGAVIALRKQLGISFDELNKIRESAQKRVLKEIK